MAAVSLVLLLACSKVRTFLIGVRKRGAGDRRRAAWALAAVVSAQPLTESMSCRAWSHRRIGVALVALP